MKVGIVGLGHIGKKHQAAAALIPDVEIVAGVDKQATSMNNDQPVYKKISDMLANHPSIDVVAVCTPNGLHASQALACLQQGKHVICEKPMTTNKQDAEALINASLHTGKYVFCVMQNRYSPISQWLKELINQGTLGEIYSIQMCCAWNRDNRYYKPESWHGSKDMDGGTLFTQFAHYIDSLYWMFNDIRVTGGAFNNFNHEGLIEFEDSGMFSFEFGKRGQGQFFYTTSVYDKNFESTMSIIGQNGTIKVGGQYMNEVQYCHIKDYEMPSLASSDNVQNLSKIYKNAKEVLAKKEQVMTNAMDGLKVVELIENIYKFKG